MRTKALGGLITDRMVVASVVVWRWLPEYVPSHWNARGEVDGRMPRFPGAFLLPAVALGLWLLLPLLWKLDPRRANYERFVGFWVMMGGVMLAAVVPVAYSYVLWRRERRETQP